MFCCCSWLCAGFVLFVTFHTLHYTCVFFVWRHRIFFYIYVVCGSSTRLFAAVAKLCLTTCQCIFVFCCWCWCCLWTLHKICVMAQLFYYGLCYLTFLYAEWALRDRMIWTALPICCFIFSACRAFILCLLPYYLVWCVCGRYHGVVSSVFRGTVSQRLIVRTYRLDRFTERVEGNCLFVPGVVSACETLSEAGETADCDKNCRRFGRGIEFAAHVGWVQVCDARYVACMRCCSCLLSDRCVFPFWLPVLVFFWRKHALLFRVRIASGAHTTIETTCLVSFVIWIWYCWGDAFLVGRGGTQGSGWGLVDWSAVSTTLPGTRGAHSHSRSRQYVLPPVILVATRDALLILQVPPWQANWIIWIRNWKNICILVPMCFGGLDFYRSNRFATWMTLNSTNWWETRRTGHSLAD